MNNKTQLTPSSPFFCPEGIWELTAIAGIPSYPTSAGNDTPNVGVTYTLTGGQKFNIPCWYQPLSGNLAVNTFPFTGPDTETHPTPFIAFNKTDDVALNQLQYHRTLSKIRKSAEFVMIVEGNSNNIRNPGTPDTNPHRMPRLAARHGRKSTDGTEAWTNMAFFDGHVTLIESVKIDVNDLSKGVDYGFDQFHNDTIGFLDHQ